MLMHHLSTTTPIGLRALFPFTLVMSRQIQALLSLVLLLGAFMLYRRFRRWPALLILVGAIGFVILRVGNIVLVYTFPSGSSPSAAIVWGWSVLDAVAAAATVFLPIGLLAFSIHRYERI